MGQTDSSQGVHSQTECAERPAPSRVQSFSTTRVAFFLCPVVFFLSYCFTRNPDFAWIYQHLGAEYYNVARALADGRGFSDPFGEPTGPTAWMPPVFPAIIALCLSIFETRSAATTAIISLTNVALVVIGVVIYSVCRRAATWLSPLVAVVFYLLWISVFNFSFFRFTHDVWLIALLVAMMCLAVSRLMSSQAVPVLAWGVLAGGATLVSPAVAAAWCALSAYLFWRAKAQRRQWLLAGAIALSIATPWTVRNALVFERFIPAKSNAGFELYLANVAYPSGIYDTRALISHPHNDPVLRFQYAQLSEGTYIALHQREFFTALKARPLDYLRRVANRLLAVTVRLPEYGINPGLRGHVVRSILHVLPLLVLICSVRVRGPNHRFIALLAIFWCLYLTPYILVAFYMRYWLPLTPLLVIIFFLGLDQLAGSQSERLRNSRLWLEGWLFPDSPPTT